MSSRRPPPPPPKKGLLQQLLDALVARAGVYITLATVVVVTGSALAAWPKIAEWCGNNCFASKQYARSVATEAALKAQLDSEKGITPLRDILKQQTIQLENLGLFRDVTLVKSYQESLKTTEDEFAKNPTSTVLPGYIADLKRKISETQTRIDKASRHGAE